MEYRLFLTVIALFIGASIGSFLNVLIHRVPLGESVMYPPSSCPQCGNRLRWYHNLPLLSWIFLKGRCAFCGEPISIRYPLVELTGAAIFGIVVYKNPSADSFVIALGFSLIAALALIDLKYKAVPDSINISALFLFIAGAPHIMEALQNALLFAGGFSLLRITVGFYVSLKEEFRLKKRVKEAPWLKSYFKIPPNVEALGEGDIPVAAAIGALLGIKAGVFALFLAALLAIFVSILSRKKNPELPFIPFLGLSMFIVYIFDENVTNLLEYLLHG